MRLTNVLISNKTPYEIEINGTIDNKQFKVLPSAVEWVVKDPSICKVDENGVLHALKNGTTTVLGRLGSTTMSLNVQVEMVESDVLLWDIIELMPI